MKKIDLNGPWKIKGGKFETERIVPCSVYSALLDKNLIEDPFYRDNELKTLAITDEEFTFSRNFIFHKREKKSFCVVKGLI